ncbi:MAG: hypothetical protein Q8O10_06355 [candidate division Zixibacteria bacterium]|nr:hypothetical protein [candidate division Zixibacteria bacterium]
MVRKFVFGMVIFFLLALSVWGEERNISLTIYNQDLALVKDTRDISFVSGRNEIKFSEVAEKIDPTSVHFQVLSAPEKIYLLEQNYQYDLVSSDKILEKYLDKNIQILTKDGKFYEGVLLSYAPDNLTLREKENSIRIVNRAQVIDLSFPKLPEGLITRPTLVWLLDSKIQGKQKTEVSYLTNGINWHTEYVAVADKDDKNLELSGWVSIDNRSGATYPNAKLKLIAGEVHRVEERVVRPLYKAGGEMALGMAPPTFEEKPFFEYHLYTLQFPSTVKDNEIKQISLFPNSSVKVAKIYVYDGAREPKKVKVNLEFMNSKAEGLGMPLPKGKIRVYKVDVDKSMEFVGEDQINHTPKDEKVRVYVGDAFDIVGERTRTNFQKISDNVMEETYQLKLRNHKEEKVEVTVVEHLYPYTNWEILESNFKYEKKDASTIEFNIPLEKNQEQIVNYKVRYSS